MAFEELPADYAKFFETGELPAALAAEQSTATVIPDAAPESPVVMPSTPDSQHVVAPTTPAPVVETPTPAPVAKTAEIPAVPVAPTTNPYLERLLAESDAARQAVEKQVAELKANIDKLTATPPPDKATDPLGYMQHQMEALQKQLADIASANTAQTQQTEQQRQMATLQNHINTQVGDFVKDHADYPDAYKHLVAMRTQDFVDLGLNEAQVQQALNQEANSIMQRALVTGKNPAELAYGMAKRYGYQAKAPVAATPNAENKLETIRKGMEAAGGLDRTSPPGAGDINLDNIKNMSDRDMNKAIETNWEGIFGASKKGSIF